MSKKLTNDDIIERMYDLVGDEYNKLDSFYINAQTKFDIRHNTCGHEYEVSWNKFKSGRRCPKCGGSLKLTNEDIVMKIYELVGDEYSKLDDTYINSSTKFSIKHNTCGHEYKIAWNTFQSGVRCPKCSLEQRGLKRTLSNDYILRKINELVNDEYTKLDDVYFNSTTKFLIRHNVCGHEYEVKWCNFQQGKRCPKCNQSKGEKFISDCLINQNISFTSQVKFNDCRNERTLPFDFGIVDSNNNIIALIEFDGIQHFEPVERFGGEKAFELTQLRDSIKNDYCKDNNIPLLRVKYNENIEERLEVFLASLFV